jgi:pyruvate/2-oxoglutarate dehydrogenase complex dihydrolipoamide acyltransferase (E2) component
MPKVAILMPQLGESIAEATIMQLLVKPGDIVQADQEVFEVETNKAVMGVTTVCGGTVISLDARPGETLPVGAIMGIIEATEEEIERSGATPLDENATPLEELLVMMKYLVRHNDAHAQEVADLARNLQGAGRIDVYDEIMDAVADFDMVNAKLDAVLNKLLMEEY